MLEGVGARAPWRTSSRASPQYEAGKEPFRRKERFDNVFVFSRSHVKSDTPVRLDFQHMRMEVNYYRSELRRLSTESYVKKPSDVLATRWVWYRLSDQGEWNEYGNKVE